MNFKNHILQVNTILSISIVFSLAVNFLRPNSIPLLSKDLEQAETIDIDSDEPTLLTISNTDCLFGRKKYTVTAKKGGLKITTVVALIQKIFSFDRFIVSFKQIICKKV